MDKRLNDEIGFALHYSPFISIFTRYIDNGRESFEWRIAGVTTSFQAITAAIGGILAEEYGFDIIFVATGIFIFIGSLIPVTIYKAFLERLEYEI